VVLPRRGRWLVDDYLAWVAARLRPNSALAPSYDVEVFFSVVGKDGAEVTVADVLGVHATPRRTRA
jgi:hypothetical protein